MDIIERAGPANLEAESRVLGVMLSDPLAVECAKTLITADCFFVQSHRHIFEAIVALNERSVPVDTITASEELERMGALEEMGGLPYVFEIASSFVPFENFEHYCRIMAKGTQQRKLVALFKKNLDELVAIPVESPDELFTKLALIEQELRAGIPEQTKFANYNEEVKKIVAEGAEEKRGLLTGNLDLDEHIDLRPGQIMVIYGDSGHKKTTLALNFAVHWAKNNRVVFFSTEQKPGDLTKIAYGIEGKEPTIPDDNLIFSENMPTVEVMVAQIKLLNAKTGLDVVFLDYLQDLGTDNMKNYWDETPRTSYFMHLLKQLAMRENLAIVVVSQMRKRQGESISDNPSVDSLRGSGDVKMASSIILSVVDPIKTGLLTCDGKSTKNMLLIRVKKNRNCLTGNPGEERLIKVQNVPGSRKIEAFSDREEEEEPEHYYQKD